MARNLDDIEIVEPPIGELTKTRSSFRGACFTGFGCVIFFIIAVIIALRLLIGSGPSALSSVPANFPADVPVYDKDNIEQITFISGKYKNRSIEVASFFPKIILSPLIVSVQDDSGGAQKMLERKKSDKSFWKRFWNLLSAPVAEWRDTVQIEWADTNTEPGFVVSYYKKELEKKGFETGQISRRPNLKQQQFSFSRTDGVEGVLIVEGSQNKDKGGIGYMILTVNFYAQPVK